MMRGLRRAVRDSGHPTPVRHFFLSIDQYRVITAPQPVRELLCSGWNMKRIVGENCRSSLPEFTWPNVIPFRLYHLPREARIWWEPRLSLTFVSILKNSYTPLQHYEQHFYFSFTMLVKYQLPFTTTFFSASQSVLLTWMLKTIPECADPRGSPVSRSQAAFRGMDPAESSNYYDDGGYTRIT